MRRTGALSRNLGNTILSIIVNIIFDIIFTYKNCYGMKASNYLIQRERELFVQKKIMISFRLLKDLILLICIFTKILKMSSILKFIMFLTINTESLKRTMNVS